MGQEGSLRHKSRGASACPNTLTTPLPSSPLLSPLFQPAAVIDLTVPLVGAAWLPSNPSAAVAALGDGTVAALELTRCPRTPLTVQRLLRPGVAPTCVAVGGGPAALVAVGDMRGRVVVARPSPNVRWPKAAVEAEAEGELKEESGLGEEEEEGNSGGGGDHRAAAEATSDDTGAARLEAVLDGLRAAGAGC